MFLITLRKKLLKLKSNFFISSDIKLSPYVNFDYKLEDTGVHLVQYLFFN